MKRNSDWPEKLNAYLDAVRGKSFVWGMLDCSTFVADSIKAMTGEDPATELRGYTDAAGAYAKLLGYCGGSLPFALEKMAAQYGWTEWDGWKRAQRGDVLLLDASTVAADPRFGGVAAICVGPLAAVMSEKGLVLVRMSHAIRAWHFD